MWTGCTGRVADDDALLAALREGWIAVEPLRNIVGKTAGY
jgi:hypothetical protein